MNQISIAPASLADLDDVERVFAGGGDGPSCQCQWWTLPATEWRSCDRAEKQRLFEQELTLPLSPGLIARVDGEPAGWVRVGPRSALPRLLNTRIVKSGAPLPLDDPGVWAISCFSVRADHRGRGLMATLLDAAVTFGREAGATRIEGYPIDTTAVKATSNDLYVGTVDMFERAGFAVASRPTPRRAVVTLESGNAALR